MQRKHHSSLRKRPLEGEIEYIFFLLGRRGEAGYGTYKQLAVTLFVTRLWGGVPFVRGGSYTVTFNMVLPALPSSTPSASLLTELCRDRLSLHSDHFFQSLGEGLHAALDLSFCYLVEFHGDPAP